MEIDTTRGFSAGVDYITATSNDEEGNRCLQELGERLLNQENSAGNDICSFWLANFSGLTCGSVQAATTGRMRLLRLSGHLANKHWRRVASKASNISRFDVQETVAFKGDSTLLPEKLERAALTYAKEHDSRRMVELRRNNKTGKTLYVGSRKSDYFARIYDKGAESRLPELVGFWRAEVELHRNPAFKLAKQWIEVEDEVTASQSFVRTWLYRAGIPWGAPITSPGLAAQLLTPEPAQSDVRRRLMWLRSQVAPTIARLEGRVTLDEILESLGLMTKFPRQ